MNKRRIAVIALLVLAVLLGGYFGVQALTGKSQPVLKASGTIDAVDVNVSPELSGRVRDVLVDEGQTVKTGDPLLHLDDTLLQAQKQQAVAALEVAQAAASTADAALASAQNQYDLALTASLATDKTQRTSQWVNSPPSEFNLPLWYYTQTEQMNAAQSAVEAAQNALTDAQNQLADVEASAAGADFEKIEKDLASAQAGYQVANDLNNRVQNGVDVDQLTRYGLYQLAKQEGRPSNNTGSADYLIATGNIDQNIKDFSQQLLDQAQSNLKDAQGAYEKALTTQGAQDVLKARALVSLDQERVNTAMDYVSYLRTGNQSPQVSTAQVALAQAKAADDQAHKTVLEAQASVDLINAQMAKLTVYAPMDGVILTRSIQPGEFVQAGGPALTMANLSSLTITVYIPEDRYGQISLNQAATVSVDSFPGQTFQAWVIYISDQAEFTPRNVQTVEGRSSTVYAVKLTVSDSQGKLKPGMPADVTFK